MHEVEGIGREADGAAATLFIAGILLPVPTHGDHSFRSMTTGGGGGAEA